MSSKIFEKLSAEYFRCIYLNYSRFEIAADARHKGMKGQVY
jgi:hypothetical protein